MIHPSIGELTNNGQINRYTLVVATAKCARIITDEYVRQKELAEKLALSKESEKKSALTAMIKREKAVKNAISGLYSGEFKIVDEAEKAEEAEKEEAEEAEETAEENTAEEAADEE